MMISIFLDESGQFENNQESDSAVVGGLLIKHSSDTFLSEYCESLREKLSQISMEIRNDLNFHKYLHGIERDFNVTNKIIEEILNDRNTIEQVVPIYIQRSNYSRMINSNVSDDNNAHILYFNMLNTIISNVLLYTPNLLDNETNVQLFLASRLAAHDMNDLKKINEFKSVALYGHSDNRGTMKYHLSNETSVLVHLNRELQFYPFLQNKIKVSIYKNTIHYDHSKLTGNDHMEIYYLADIICNHVFHAKKSPQFGGNRLHKSLSYAYGDINEDYLGIFRAYYEQNWFKFHSEVHRFNNNYRTENKRSYKKFIEILEVGYSAHEDGNAMKLFLFNMEQFMLERSYCHKKARYLIDKLQLKEGLLEKENKLVLFDLSLQVYNHIGAYDDSKLVFKKAIAIANQVGSYDALNRKRSIMNRYATTCANGFDFEQGLEIVEQLIDSQIAFQQMMHTSNGVLFNEELLIDTDELLGKLYSSKGQFLSFLEQNHSIDCFHLALNKFGNDKRNRLQTLSYLTHAVAKPDMIMTTKEREAVNEYLGEGEFERRIESYINCDAIDKQVSNSFKLYAMLKYYRYQLPQHMNESLLIKLAEKIEKYSELNMNHPWPLIYVNLAEMIESKEKKLAHTLYTKAYKICDNSGSELTLRLIGGMIKIRAKKNESSVNSFIELIHDTGNEQVRAYFEVDTIDELSWQKKMDHFDAKFTFMYR